MFIKSLDKNAHDQSRNQGKTIGILQALRL